MQIVIDIPEYEFKSDIEDNFQDFFQRVIVDISNNNSTLCGNYELETAQMLLSAFKYATVLPKGHGRLIDADAIMEYCQNDKSKVIDCNDIARFPTIIRRE